MANVTISSDIDDVLKAADDAAAITELGAADTGSAQTLTNKRVTRRVVSVAYGATITPNIDTTGVLVVGALTGDVGLAIPTGTPADRDVLEVIFRQDGTGGRSLTLDVDYIIPTSSALTHAITSGTNPDFAAANAESVLTLCYRASDTCWQVRGFIDGYAEPVTYDADALAIIEAIQATDAGLLSATEKGAIDAFVIDYKAQGLWAKTDILYGFVGGTAESHAINWKSPGTDITWAGTVTHNANGSAGNGTTGYGDTGVARNALPQTLFHAIANVKTINAGGAIIGCDNFGGAGNHYMQLLINGTAGQFRNNSTSTNVDATGAPVGVLIGSRTAGDDQIMASDESSFTTSTQAAPAVNLANNIYVLAINRLDSAVGFTDSVVNFIAAGDTIDATEAQAAQTAIETLQAALGR